MMNVHRTGTTFRAARITGPTHHFLAVEFAQSSEPYEILFVDTQEVVDDQDVMSCLQRAVEDCSGRLPIHGTYRIKRLLISLGDTPSEDAYRQLLLKIISCATEGPIGLVTSA